MSAVTTASSRAPLAAYLWGLVGVVAFGLTLPATRLAVTHLDAWWVSFARASLAALVAGMILLITGGPRPTRAEFGLLLLTGAGVVLGFPLFTTLAMTVTSASHGAVVVGLLPLATAVTGALIGRERHSALFWVLSVLGSVTVVGFALLEGAGQLSWADLALLGSVISASVGYASGARLARRLAGWRVICWALVVCSPLVLPPMLWLTPRVALSAPPAAWLSFLYISLASQLFGFFAWYRGLALGGIARVGQVQLLQLFITLIASSLWLGETVDARTWLFGTLVVLIVAVGRRA